MEATGCWVSGFEKGLVHVEEKFIIVLNWELFLSRV